jgi:hypothetical protein
MKFSPQSIAGIKAVILFTGLLPTFLLPQNDTLATLYEFNSPTPCPWGLAYDGRNLFLGDDSLGRIYKTGTEGTVLRTMEFPGRCLKGMTFYKNDLWVVDDRSVGDTARYSDTVRYKIYTILKVDTASGTISDSIRIIAPAGNTPATNFLWGIGSYNSRLYVSYNGGYGDCTYEIDPTTKMTAGHLCCAHPSGFTTINGSLWCVRQGSMNGSGNYVCEMEFFYWNNDTTYKGLREKTPWHHLNCHASDLTFDGENIWICDYTNKKIKKLAMPTTQNRSMHQTTGVPIQHQLNFTNSFGSSTVVKYAVLSPGTVNLQMYDARGREVTSLVNEYRDVGNYEVKLTARKLPAGVYVIRLCVSKVSQAMAGIVNR